MQSSHLNEKQSVERMLIELEKLQMIENQNGEYVGVEKTMKKNDILEALDKI